MKRIIAALLLIAMLSCMLAACQEKEITSVEAMKIVQQDLGDASAEGTPHIHEGKFQDKECFFVYITVRGENLVYAVEKATGDILKKEHSTHSH